MKSQGISFQTKSGHPDDTIEDFTRYASLSKIGIVTIHQPYLLKDLFDTCYFLTFINRFSNS